MYDDTTRRRGCHKEKRAGDGTKRFAGQPADPPTRGRWKTCAETASPLSRGRRGRGQNMQLFFGQCQVGPVSRARPGRRRVSRQGLQALSQFLVPLGGTCTITRPNPHRTAVPPRCQHRAGDVHPGAEDRGSQGRVGTLEHFDRQPDAIPPFCNPTSIATVRAAVLPSRKSRAPQ